MSTEHNEENTVAEKSQPKSKSKSKSAPERTPMPLSERGALDLESAAEYLSMSSSTLRRITKAGKIRHARYGRLVRYRRVDLDEWTEKNIVG